MSQHTSVFLNVSIIPLIQAKGGTNIDELPVIKFLRSAIRKSAWDSDIITKRNRDVKRYVDHLQYLKETRGLDQKNGQ